MVVCVFAVNFGGAVGDCVVVGSCGTGRNLYVLGGKLKDIRFLYRIESLSANHDFEVLAVDWKDWRARGVGNVGVFIGMALLLLFCLAISFVSIL